MAAIPRIKSLFVEIFTDVGVRIVLIFIFSLASFVTTPVQADTSILFVKWNATGSSNGTSWLNAFTSQQTALNSASTGDEIWVAAGTYKPTTGANRTASFFLKEDVMIYGGFIGWETLRTQRNYETNVTILSGDIGVEGYKGDNSYHVIRSSAMSNAAVLDGFTVTLGNADGLGADYFGGGIYNFNSSPTLRNLMFTANSASHFGGGIYNEQGSAPVLTNIIVSENAAQDGGGLCNNSSSPIINHMRFDHNSASSGGGMYNYNGSNPSLTDVVFTNNSAADGGGMTNWQSSPTLVDVIFHNNSAMTHGGGIHNYENSNPRLDHVTFSNNSAIFGGGLSNSDGYYPNYPILDHVTFENNTAYDGGGIYSNGYSLTITNATFNNNVADVFGGGLYGMASLTNAVFSGNSADEGGGVNGGGSFRNVTFHQNSAALRGGGIYGTGSMTNVTFSENSADTGGGMYSYTRSSAVHDTFLRNVTFHANSASRHGGGLYSDSSATWSRSPILEHVTFSNNSAGLGGGLYNYHSNPKITNSIFYNDTYGEIHNESSGPIVTYTIVEGGYSGTGN